MSRPMNVVQFSIEPLLRVAQAFPATPRVMADLGQLLQDPSADMNDVVALLKRDSALAARMLRVANSAAFGATEHIASLEAAAALIGFKEIHRLVGAVAVDQFSHSSYPLYGFSGPHLRTHALFVALLMEELAAATGQDPHMAYTTGLFRCIGKLALEKLAAGDQSVAAFQPDGGMDLERWEKHSFGITANDATALILQQWRFPAEIGRSIGQHFAASTAPQPLPWLLNLAARSAEERGHGFPGEHRYWLEPSKVFDHCSLTPATFGSCMECATIAFQALTTALT